MSLPFRPAVTSSPVSHRRLSAQPSRQEEKSPSRFSGLFGGLLRQASDPPPPPPPERRTTFRLQDYLPQALEDRAITETVDAIQVHLESHVDHFYYFKTVPNASANRSPEPKDPPQPGELPRQPTGHIASIKSPMASRSSSYTGMSNSIQLTNQASSVASSEDRRIRSKVHYLIASRLIRAIQPARAGERAVFLPEELTMLLSALPLPESMEDDQIFTSALSQWRVLSWYLLYHKKVRKANEKDFQERLDEEIDRMLRSLDKELEPFINESNNKERQEHLRSLMEMTADLGRLITSQAAVFEFSWDYEPDDGRDIQRDLADQRENRSSRDSHHVASRSRRSKSNHNREVTVLFPALLKITDHHGLRLAKPVCVCEPQLERFKARLSRKRTEEIH